jgi:hypothetical protein
LPAHDAALETRTTKQADYIAVAAAVGLQTCCYNTQLQIVITGNRADETMNYTSTTGAVLSGSTLTVEQAAAQAWQQSAQSEGRGGSKSV